MAHIRERYSEELSRNIAMGILPPILAVQVRVRGFGVQFAGSLK